MITGGERVSAWAGVVAMSLLFTAILPLMHFVPPLAPALPTAEVAAHYRTHAFGMLLGSVFILLASCFLLPFFSALAVRMKLLEGQSSAWSYSINSLAIFTFVPLFASGVFFAAAAYRSERSDEMIHMLSDIAILFLVIPAFPAALIAFALGFATLADRRAVPIFPRWTGYLNLWFGILFIPGSIIQLFKRGPFAWDGILAFWLPFGLFGAWLCVITWLMVRNGSSTDIVE